LQRRCDKDEPYGILALFAYICRLLPPIYYARAPGDSGVASPSLIANVRGGGAKRILDAFP